MTDQPSKLPQAGEVWRKGNEVRKVAYVSRLAVYWLIGDTKRSSGSRIDSWKQWAKDAEKIA